MELKGRNFRNKLPPLTFIRELFNYNPETGELTWAKRPDHHFKTPQAAKLWNARFVGVAAGTRLVRKNGEKRYSEVGIREGQEGRTKLFFAHRVIWYLHYGEDPAGLEIDHINHDPWDNRILNLRKCTSFENGKNSRGLRDRKHDLPKGVYSDKGFLFAAIVCDGITHRLGYFNTPEEAHQAYCNAAEKLHKDFACYERKGQPLDGTAPSGVEA